MRGEHPLPSIWSAASELGPAWCKPLQHLFLCRQCGSVHSVSEDPREQVTNFARLDSASDAWFLSAEPAAAVLDSWMIAEPLTELTVWGGADVLSALRAANPAATQAHAELLLERLADARAVGELKLALLRALIALDGGFVMKDAEGLLAPRLLEDRRWLPELGRLLGAKRPIEMPPEARQRLLQACDRGRLMDEVLSRLRLAADAGQWRRFDEELIVAWRLLGQDYAPKGTACDALRELQARIEALPPDTRVERAGFDAATPSALAASVGRLIEFSATRAGTRSIDE